MPSRGLKHSAEIARLRKDGLSDGQISERLSIGKSIIHRNLYRARTKQRLAKLMAQAGLYSLKQVLVSCEVGWRWVEGERLKLLEGTSSLTAENIGTLMRSQEKSLQIARAFLGKTFSPEGLAKAEKEDPRLKKAAERMKALEGHGRTIEEEEDDHDA
jgi:hypothetical protein